MRSFTTAVLALALGSFVTLSGTIHAQCTDADLTSRNAERCAKKYAAALVACMKQGTSLASCDVSKSDEFCGLLSAGCAPKTDIADQIAAIYLAPAAADNCALRLARAGTKLATRRFIRARTHRERRLPTDLTQCIQRGAQQCSAAPPMASRCSGAISASDAAACVCTIPGCTQVPSEELGSLIPARWAGILEHASSLDYAQVDEVHSCLGVRDEERTVVAVLRNLSAPADAQTLTLWYSQRDDLAGLSRLESEGSLLLLSESGGIRVLPDGTVETVGSDGSAPAGNSRAGVGVLAAAAASAQCAGYWDEYVPCVLATRSVEILIATYLGSVACGPGAVACAVAIHIAVAVALEEDRSQPECLPPRCDLNWTCSRLDVCALGVCVAGIPDNIGLPCTNERTFVAFPALPHCRILPLGTGDIYRTAHCQALRALPTCVRDSAEHCPPEQPCVGSPGSAHCETTTTTPTSSPTSTTLCPPFAETLVESSPISPDGYVATSVLNEPDGVIAEFDDSVGGGPGFFVVTFGGRDPVPIGAGPDLRIYLWDVDQPYESFSVLGSADGVTFTTIASVQPPVIADQYQTVSVEFGSLTDVRYVKVVNSNAGLHYGAEFDALEALQCY